MFDQASVNASGQSGGGTVLVGGDYQGKNPSVQNASATYVGADASVKADAITSGNITTVNAGCYIFGGLVGVTSSVPTRFRAL